MGELASSPMPVGRWRPGPGGLSVGFPRRANRVQVEPPGHAMWPQVCVGVSERSDRETGGGWARML